MPATPRGYQSKGVQFLSERRGALLGDEMGLGKTYQAVWACKELQGPILVICINLNKPYFASVVRELDPGAEISFAGQAGIFDEPRVRKWFRFPRKRGYLFMHHEGLRFAQKSLRGLGIWDAVVADEAHRFKNRKAQMTKALKSVTSFHRWALTGTPIEKSPADLWSLLNWFDAPHFGSYWKFFEDMVEYTDGWFGGRTIVGPKKPEAFAQVVAPYYLRRLQVDVEPELPKIIYKNVPIDLLPAQRRLYDELDKQTFVDINTSEHNTLFVKNTLARLTHLTRCALAPGLLGSDVESAKLQWLQAFAKETTDQFVVFTRFREFAHGVAIGLGKRAGVIAGDVKLETRNKVLEAFQKGDTQVLIGTYQTIGQSINLQNAHIGIFTDIHRSSILMQQSEMRLSRIGQKEHPLIIRLLGVDTYDEEMLEAYDKKLTDIALIDRYLKKHNLHYRV